MRVFVALALFAVGCSSDSPMKERPTLYGGDRQTSLRVPENFDESKDYPLVVVLHGYGANGFVQESYFQSKAYATNGDAFVMAPDGLVDDTGKQFWNADSQCCDFGGKNPDDVGFIGGLIDDVSKDWPIDANKVFLIGHSNGGYMSYRMSCDRADIIAGIVVLAGVASSMPASCNPSKPVNILHMHGTADDTVPFSTVESSISEWSQKDGCGTTKTDGPTLDIESSLAGNETTTATVNGCPAGTTIEQWSIEGASHIPNFVPTIGQTLWTWLNAHAR